MADDIKTALTEMEALEVDERKSLESSFKTYMATPLGKKTLESSERRRRALGTNYKRKEPVGKVIDRLRPIEIIGVQDESAVKDMKF